MFKYYLTYNTVKTEIEKEPIGWDDFAVSLKRNEKSHGISAEFSEMSLRFWCYTSMGILHAAYDADIDSIVTFSVENDNVEAYSGQVDFAEFKDGFDRYNYIEVKVSEIGIQATFNNRIEQKVNIDSLVAFDGAVLPVYANLNKEITLPGKDIILISKSENKVDSEIEIGQLTFDQGINQNEHFRIDFAFTESVVEELNDYFGVGESVVIYGGKQAVESNGYPDAPPIFLKSDSYDALVNTFEVKFNISCKISLDLPATGTLKGRLLVQMGGAKVDVFSTFTQTVIGNNISFAASQTIAFSDLDKLYLCAELSYTMPMPFLNSFTGIHVKVDHGSYLSVSAFTTVPDTTSRISLIHETTSRIIEIISNNQLKVKSDYYGRINSNINPVVANGYGSLKAISTGLRIRNAIMSDGSLPALTLSFADIIKGLTPIDNIGYGFEKNGGTLDLRVEKWDYFYKSDVIFEINNPSKIARSLNPTDIISRVKVGYKKYTSGDTNSIDGFHSEREYRTRVKLVETLLEQLSEFISDSYAIEYTRRLALKKDTKDWQYDDDIFLFVLKDVYRTYTTSPSSNGSRYEIDLGVTDSGNTIISPTTVYNSRISPARIVLNWLNKIFSFRKTAIEVLTYTSGTGNVTATFKPVITPYLPGVDPVKGNYTDAFTYHGSKNEVVSENGNFQSGSVILKPEILTINEYPLTRAEYEIIKNNPYGTITVDGELCFLKSLNYKFKTGMATFTLIPKYE